MRVNIYPFDSFQRFSKALGFVVNLRKSSTYCGGISRAKEHGLIDLLGFSKGYLSFRYLWVPLSTKRVSIVQCQPLLEKMLGRIKL